MSLDDGAVVELLDLGKGFCLAAGATAIRAGLVAARIRAVVQHEQLRAALLCDLGHFLGRHMIGTPIRLPGRGDPGGRTQRVDLHDEQVALLAGLGQRGRGPCIAGNHDAFVCRVDAVPERDPGAVRNGYRRDGDVVVLQYDAGRDLVDIDLIAMRW